MTKAKPSGSPGYTFPLMLIIVAVMAFGASRIQVAESYRLRRDKEEELLFRGMAYVQALRAFQQKNQRYPRQLDELASRRPDARRFIRQLYKDPMTGGDFQPILSAQREIIGVVSSSKDTPFRKVGFEVEFESFAKAKTYGDWKFKVQPMSPALAPGHSMRL